MGFDGVDEIACTLYRMCETRGRIVSKTPVTWCRIARCPGEDLSKDVLADYFISPVPACGRCHIDASFSARAGCPGQPKSQVPRVRALECSSETTFLKLRDVSRRERCLKTPWSLWDRCVCVLPGRLRYVPLPGLMAFSKRVATGEVHGVNCNLIVTLSTGAGHAQVANWVGMGAAERVRMTTCAQPLLLYSRCCT